MCDHEGEDVSTVLASQMPVAQRSQCNQPYSQTTSGSTVETLYV
jgi:hypothetical protein